MRKLSFRVIGQSLQKFGDFSGLVSGSSHYLYLSFDFDDQWTGFVKVAEFKGDKRGVIPVPIINNKCEVPEDVTHDAAWRIRVVGKKQDVMIRTNERVIYQEVQHDD